MFYRKLFILGLPIILRNTLSSFNGFIDNIMVGGLGSSEISAASIINQILFIFCCTFVGTNAVIGLYSTQYFGIGDYLGIKKIFFIKIIISLFLLFLFSVLIYLFYDKLILLYMTRGDEITKNNMFKLCKEYFVFSYLSLLPFIITQIFSSTLNESGNTILPMFLCLLATLTNALLNYLFIYGNFGFPRLELTGAALATFLSRFIEAAVVIILRKKFIFFKNIFKNILIDINLLYLIVKKAVPIYINEFLFSFSFVVIAQIYSLQSIDNIVIMSVTGTLSIFFMNLIFAIGYSSEILIGHQLGQSNFDLAYLYSKKTLLFAFVIGLFFIPIIFMSSSYFPMLYDLNTEIIENISKCICSFALNFYLLSTGGVIFYILRSGGRILLLSIIDCGFFWLLVIPCQYLLVKYSTLKIFEIYFVTLFLNIIKCLVGIYFIKTKTWMRNLIIK